MKDPHDEYIYTGDHRPRAEREAATREALMGWISFVASTAATFFLANFFLVK